MNISQNKNKRIGGLELDNALWLAPLAGVTTPPVREFFSRLGAGLTHTEMVSCMGLLRDNRKTQGMLRLLSGEGPVVLQLFSGDADTMVRGAQVALECCSQSSTSLASFAALGINMACPMPKVTKRGAGAALMGRPEVAFEMVRSLKRLELPVWVKIRRTSDEEETLRFVEGLVDAGSENVCVHGRTPAQRYEGRADRIIVAAASCRFPGKISASGDVSHVEDVKEYLDMGCVGVMLARGALANPYLFPLTLRALGRQVPDELWNPTPEQRFQRLRSLSERSQEVSGLSATLVLLKRLMAGMFKGVPGAAELRRRAGSATRLDELLSFLAEGVGEMSPSPVPFDIADLEISREPATKDLCESLSCFERSGTDDLRV
ncbi:MAG: tRNA-dihydrouridine synthase family protein [Synergistaceae bacterium]|nr:tRNA-dihydrouridine synthase family protein [Synergistaceae bacterium]